MVKQTDDQLEATWLRCKCWHCEMCEPGRRALIRELAIAGRPTTFITLTVNPEVGEDADHRARLLVNAWQLLVKRIKRRYALSRLPYLQVIERTKRGEPHMHILARVHWIDQRWLSDQMASIIQAPVVWIERVTDRGKAAAYVAKYISKLPSRYLGCKRYTRSQDWIVDIDAWRQWRDQHKGGWTVFNVRLDTVAAWFTVNGWALLEVRPGYLRAERTDDAKDVFRAAA